MTKKKHLYEVDLMRCFFMFGVVLNHVASTFAAALGNKATPAGRFLAFLLLTSGSFSWNKWLTGWLEAISKGNQFYFSPPSCASSQLLLLDNPLGALDALTRSKMQELILQVCNEDSARYPRRPGSHHHGQQDLGHQKPRDRDRNDQRLPRPRR